MAITGIMDIGNSVNNMYPQVYNIIDPVASRVIANNNYPYYTEDNLNNMVDTVYNIVQGDLATLTSTTTTATMESDDTVTQGPARGATPNTNTKNTNSVEVTRTVTTSNAQTTGNDNQLLKDLIKIIIIKQLLSRNNGSGCGCNMNPYTPNYYMPPYQGMM